VTAFRPTLSCGNRFADRLVSPQLAAGMESMGPEPVRTMPDSGLMHAFGTEQATDMVGPERWGRWHGDSGR
jgi:hypothetical protein